MPRKVRSVSKASLPLQGALVSIYREVLPSEAVSAELAEFWRVAGKASVSEGAIAALVGRLQAKVTESPEKDILQTQALAVVNYTLSVELGYDIKEG